MTSAIYAIGDIHGQNEMLVQALERIHRDGGPDAEIVFLGDFVDRGPNSAAVLQTLVDGIKAGRKWHALRGNHDILFLNYLNHATMTHPRTTKPVGWLSERLGGRETLMSYGVDMASVPRDIWLSARANVPPSHWELLQNLVPYHIHGDLLFVHGGIKPGVALDDQDPEDFSWIRHEFNDHKDPHPWLVVHGHTALDHPTHFGNRVDLDGGAGKGRPLFPAVFDGGRCFLLKEHGREALDPAV